MEVPAASRPPITARHDGDVVVVGAGPAGLQVAACLQQHGRNVVVLERDRVAASWYHFYDGLQLHTHRRWSDLLGSPYPQRYGPWVARDDVIEHLEAYARTRRLDIRTGVAVTRVDERHAAWEVETSDAGSLAARTVVVATGFNAHPRVPDWPGRARFAGEVLHARDYRSASSFQGRRVLVVGTGNTGAEIATQLARGGAREVHLSVRSGAHVLPRDVHGIPSQLPAILLRRLPDRVLDRLLGRVEDAVNGDLPERGLHRPERGVASDLSARDVLPVLDVGLSQAVRDGVVHPAAAVEEYLPDGVLLADGRRLVVDVVIAATGYRNGLEPLVGHLGVLDERQLPTPRGRGRPTRPGLYFVGYSNSIAGLLFTIKKEAAGVCRTERRRALPLGC